MKFENLSKQMENLDEKQKNAILAIIDLKMDNEMEKVLNKIDAMQSSMDRNVKTLMFLIGALGLLITLMKFLK